MCVKLVNAHQEIPYDSSKPLEEQLNGCEQIVVNYEPFDKSVDALIAEVERIARTGIDAKLTIKVVHNDHIFGFKVKQRLKRATNDITLNEIIKLMVLTHCSIDRKLEDLANTFNGSGNEQQKA
ncbi:MAG: hypothetical protein HC840_00225 [Leptolyngbyaceae cyanobacterium RM2_2_4]|nr:hypothetical protein [Leptolyngbyaceae cyanobacterium RM2_2_4]